MLPAVRELLRTAGIHEVRVTTAPGEEQRLARDAATAGAETIIALGGDGTWSKVARGILESERDARLVIMAAGTGNDFGHSLGLPAADYAAMTRIAISPRSERIDLGRMDGHAFLNVAGAGIATEVLQAIQSPSLLRGSLRYLAAAIPRLHRFGAIGARICCDDMARGDPASYLAIIASNGTRFGGGFRVAPHASVQDGLLDLITVRDASLPRRAALLVRARFGRHLAESEVGHAHIRRCVVTFSEPPVLDVDGELVRAASNAVEIECVTRALRLGLPGEAQKKP